MAVYPCTADGRRFKGAALHVYPAVLRGRDGLREHLRLCPDHFDQLIDLCQKTLEEVDFDAPHPTTEAFEVCSFCGSDSHGSHQTFVTTYAGNDDERTFYGRCCQNCLSRVQESFYLRS